MFESYKLKKAKAKLELESINKQLNEIEAQKEKERWDRMPLWERNIKIEKLKLAAGLIEPERNSVGYRLTISIIEVLLILGLVYFSVDMFSPGTLPYKVLNCLSPWHSLIINVGGRVFVVIFLVVLVYWLYDRIN